jgi:proline iminopeptidase
MDRSSPAAPPTGGPAPGDLRRRRLCGALVATLCGTARHATTAAATPLHAKSYGRAGGSALLFLHGGPGYNGFLFEATTAAALAALGYQVVVFDQRGCGRSAPGTAPKYDFDEAVADIDAVIARFGLKQPVLLGHGFGGAIGLAFAERLPQRLGGLVWLDAPVSYPRTFRTILAAARAVYTTGDPQQLRFIDMLEHADPASFDYASYTLMHARAVGLYRPRDPSAAARRLYQAAAALPDGPLLQSSRGEVLRGFQASSRFTLLELAERAAAVAARTPLASIHGEEDGQLDAEQRAIIARIVGAKRAVAVPEASHNVFVDNQPVFLSELVRILRDE